jgi:lipoprotein-anchoring transpeptidase ErfK/SrfK
MRVIAAALVAGVPALAAGVQPADAGIVVNIDKSAQRMSVSVDGAHRYTWKISTGLRSGPPSGSYKPQRLERKWYSRKFGWAPMPH